MNIPRIALLYMFLGLAGLLALPIYLLLSEANADTFIFKHRGKVKRWRKWHNSNADADRNMR